MGIHDKDLLSGKDKIETSIERIKTYCFGKRTLVAFSGGKDSQCCYHLCKMAGIDFAAQYSITRFEPPELVRFIREHYPDVTFRRAYKRSLIEDIAKKGLPNRWSRWCCDSKHKKTEGIDIAVIGIRFEESARRRDTWRMFGRKQDGSSYVCPICDWTSADVWEFLNENNIPHCSLYDEGYRRIGCVCCPLAPGKGDEKRWPKFANVLKMGYIKHLLRSDFKSQRTIDIVSEEKKDPNRYFKNWIERGVVHPPETDQAKDEPCLFAGTGFSESDGVGRDD